MKKSILITGCSSGIGLYCAKKLHEQGFDVIASCRKVEDVENLKSLGLKCIQLDLSDSLSIKNGFSQALSLLNGKLDILFNNGAYGQPGAVEDLPTNALRQQFETNLFGWHELTILTLKHMREHNSGRIIQNSSVLGLIALPYRGAYNASKFALEGLTDTLRMELKDSNINICLIEPGPIKSMFRANALKAFNDNIDTNNSFHKKNYLLQKQRLEKHTKTSTFTLAPNAVYKCLYHAIESKKPKARYYVTFPTYLFGYLKRILSTNILDKLLNKSL
ncbi:SDR family oxidoreductase [Pseudoalteromonas denitrificans]|uniref:NAD(P)-dependent dehydrogenase, short-chain alcohol dehydrogenase family n=1 Tax=Pseudoalteromonas denitrificans DSM 6059 TaxID=1123010 RepID=A0A1I1PA05_9GAMM|nr:SDR family oxidoreductase [Pseudoalteromonas denitrificans]SFD06781.1 NAD(P)-dependent dehydrogenase, short-chain alcohol dehydrogenase family [Pseudoalteromonas denitrificans DSM 6059]